MFSSTLAPSLSFLALVKFAVYGSWLLAAFWFFRLFVYWPRRSRLTRLPGPPPVGRVFGGHLRPIMEPKLSPQGHEDLRQKYGLNLRVHGMGYFDERYVTFDPVAINFILGRAADLFPKPWQSRRFIERLVGKGLFVSEGDDHRRQRKIISPAFSAQSLRALQPIFFSKAVELRDAMGHGLQQKAGEEKSVTMDMNNWLWRTTFDIIGLAGFAYPFDSIRDESNEVYLAYRDMFQVGITKGFSFKSILEVWFPWVGVVFPDERNRVIKNSQQIINRVGGDIVQRKKEEIMNEKAFGQASKSKDMLSLLIQANLLEDSVQNRLSDEELLDQISTLLFVGSDTTSIAMAWILHFLSQNLDAQDALRRALKTCLSSPSDLNSSAIQNAVMTLPYLDYVIKEALRLIPPVHSTLRVAAEDTPIPTSDGTEVFIRKGQFVHVAFEAFNTRKDVWGDDAFEFKPERWADLPRAAKEGPGLVMGLMSFSLGPHSCPGYQFSMLEMKALLAALIPSFVFDKVPDQVITMGNIIVTRPFVKGMADRVSRLPLIVRPCSP